jgi:SAM-dependent methyltransferase
MTDSNLQGEVPIVKIGRVHYADMAEVERGKNLELWRDVPDYGKFSPGEENVEPFMQVVKPPLSLMSGPMTLLDAGCGSGRAGLLFEGKGIQVTYLDITDAGLDPRVRRNRFIEQPLWKPFPVSRYWDYVFCCDVMEHVPIEFTMMTIGNLLSRCTRSAWFQIALVPDEFGKAIGRPVHVTVQPFIWWRDRFATLGNLVDARDFGLRALYIVERK